MSNATNYEIQNFDYAAAITWAELAANLEAKNAGQQFEDIYKRFIHHLI